MDDLPDHERAALNQIVQLLKHDQPDLEVDIDSIDVLLHRRNDGYFDLSLKSSATEGCFLKTNTSVTWVEPPPATRR